MKLGLLISELRRRRVIRALVGYGIAAFAVLQILEPVMHGLHWPDVVLSYVVVALALGFPVVVSLAWIFDVKDGRIEKTPPAARMNRARLAPVLLTIGVLAAAPGSVWYFYVRQIHKRAEVAPSIAVLPFVNLSSDKEQEYFSDGIAEEILNALAQVPGLRVIGRTSSFSLKGKNEDLRAIGEKLNASNLLEGSVRKSGARVRITAQLVEAADGSHLWSQQFDREMTDVFAVQDEIAKAVVAALRLKLLPPHSGALDEQRTTSPEAHDLVLLGRHFIRRGSLEGYARATEALEKAVALDPRYAPAWAALAGALWVASDQDPDRHPQARDRPRAQAAAEKAIALAPDLADGYAVRGFLRASIERNWAGARADFEHALSLSAASADTLVQYAWLLAALGKLPDAIAAAHKATAVDPLATNAWLVLSAFYLGRGELGLAEDAAKHALDISPEEARAWRNLGFVELLEGRLQEAQAAFERSGGLYLEMGKAMLQHQLGQEEDSRRTLEQLIAEPGIAESGAYQIAQVHAWRGEPDDTFAWLERAYQNQDAGLGYLKFDPFLRNVRADPRYAALLRKLNLPLD